MIKWMNTLRGRLLMTYLFLVVVSLGVVVWRLGTWVDESRFAQIRHDQIGHVALTASATEEMLEKYREGRADAVTLQQDLEDLSRKISEPIVAFDLEGKILFDSEQLQEIADVGRQPEVAGALQGTVSQDVRYDADNMSDSLYTAAPVYHDSDMIGVVRLELSMNAIVAGQRARWAKLLGAALLAAAATILISTWFARTLTEPLARVTRAASRMAAGDLNQRIEIQAPLELAELGSAFNFMAERVARVMQEQRAFVANAAHELRTPLTIIQLRADALQEGAQQDPRAAAEFLGNIQTETQRLSHLVEELLDLARIETGVRELHRERIDTADVARRAVQDLEQRARDAGVSLALASVGNLPVVNADPGQLRQVFLNLVGNAIKFTPQGGAVTVRSSTVKNGGGLGAGTWVVWQVQDTGIGIASDDLAHVFDRFYRGDNARVGSPLPSAETGAGLGLAIVRSIVELHGGRVWAESEMGKGTTVSLALRAVR